MSRTPLLLLVVVAGCARTVAVAPPAHHAHVAAAAPAHPMASTARRFYRDSWGGVCALLDDGRVACWGGDEQSGVWMVKGVHDAIGITARDELCTWNAAGLVTCQYNEVPTFPFHDVVDVTADGGTTCALSRDGRIRCLVESFEESPLGQPMPALSVTVPMTDVVEISAMWNGVCGRRRDGSVACWAKDDPRRVTEQIAGGVVSLGSGEIMDHGHSSSSTRVTALRATGEVVEIARESHDDQAVPPAPPRMPSEVRRVDIESGWSCALGPDVACWRTDVDASLTHIPGSAGAIAVSAGESPCAMFGDGHVMCWGQYGGQADGRTTITLAPVPVPGLTDAVQLSGAWDEMCARRATGGVACWGDVRDGTLVARPVVVDGIADAIDLHASGFNTCARRTTGQTACWGQYWTEAADDVTLAQPTDVPALAGVSRLFTVDSGTCGTSHGVAVCLSPSRHAARDLVAQWTEGNIVYTTCTRTTTGLTCEYGIDRHFGKSAPYPELAAIPGAVDYALQTGKPSWVLQKSGAIVGVTPTEPLVTLDARDFIGIARGPAISLKPNVVCGLHRTGTVDCWGEDGVPSPVVGLLDAVELASAGNLVCARRRTGTVACWGERRLVAPGGEQVPAPVRVALPN